MGYPLPQEARLTGPFQPMRFEATVDECIVTHGEIPKDLAGGFYRVGPTWKRPTKQGTNGLLGMDGMVQASRLRERARRLPEPLDPDAEVPTRGAARPRACSSGPTAGWHDWRDYGYGDVKRDQYTCGVSQGTNNINIFPFAGEMVASGEQGGPPIALDPITLETKGIVPWSPQAVTRTSRADGIR